MDAISLLGVFLGEICREKCKRSTSEINSYFKDYLEYFYSIGAAGEINPFVQILFFVVHYLKNWMEYLLYLNFRGILKMTLF